MGYEIHITRRKHWAHTGQPEITFAEWEAIVNSDPELELAMRNTDTVPTANTVMMFDPSRSAIRVFWYSDGAIWVKKPCTAVLIKMLDIAHKLNARVMGDDEEIYAPDGTPSHKASFDVTDGW